MTSSDLALTLFTACNGIRVLAYLPQIARVARDQHGAIAISCLTWSMFTIANLSTVFYAAFVLEDRGIMLIFSANTLCSLLVVLLAAYKRRRFT